MKVKESFQLLKSLRLRKAQALLFFLLLAPDRAFRTEMMMELLWPQSETNKSSSSLRQTIRQIRVAAHEWNGFTIEVRNESVGVKLDASARDVTSPLDKQIAELFHSNPKSLESHDYIRTFLGLLDLLQGLSDGYDSWLAYIRMRAIGLLIDLLEHATKTPDGEQGFELAKLILDVEPHNEVAARFVMKRYWTLSRANRAIEIYNTLYAYLDEFFDQEPEAETIELLAAIKLDPQYKSSDEIAGLKRPLIALQVIAGASVRPTHLETSLQGVLIGDLRMRLSRFREWVVVDNPTEGASFLRIQVTLLGPIDRAHLSVEVQNPNTGALIWSEIIADPNVEWERKVRVLVVNIANALRIVVSDRLQDSFSAQIYDKWLQSQALIGTWKSSDDEQAVRLLNSITDEVPNFGPARAELAALLNVRHILRPGTFQTEDVQMHALNHALEAVSIDPMDTRSHRVLAWCYCHRKKFDIAEFHFEQTLLLNPQNPHSLASSALGFSFTNNAKRAGELIKELELEPGTLQAFHLIYLAASNYLCGNYATAAEQCKSGSGLMSTVGGWHAAALIKLGRQQEAETRLAAYVSEITALWEGQTDPTPTAVIDWFATCFPLRDETVRQDLRETLLAAQSVSA